MSKKFFSGRERRSYVRIDTEVPVRFRICGIDSGKIYPGTTKNISHGGLCVEVLQDQDELIETLSSFEQWPTIDVAPLLPDPHGEQATQADWITSRLDWAKKPNAKDSALLMGMGFVDMDEKVRRQVYEFIVGQFLKHYSPEMVSGPRLCRPLSTFCF